jgi:adenosine 3'-phospho 5'-phosphosulfate transporter B2
MAESAAMRPGALGAAAWCCFYGAGIIGMLVIYGILQERIMSIPYGTAPPTYFRDSVFLVFCNRFVALLFAFAMALSKGEQLRNSAPFWKYLAISFSNVYASTCQYEALKYVSFPVQMLGKSFKMMPVMLWGMAVSGKHYGLSDWLVALAITGGVTEFLMTGPISSNDSSSSTYGLILLCGFLFLDGFTSTFQEKLFKEHVTSKYNQMLYINLGSCVISSGTLLASGRISAAVGFALTYPAFAMDAMSLSAAAVAGQWFIYSQVKEFGALVFAATMNVRQIVSILISYAKYGHSITTMQILGLLLVFLGLLYKSFAGFIPSNQEKQPLLPDKSELTGGAVEATHGKV